MTVEEMVKSLKTERRIEFRNDSGNTICVADSDSEGIEPYKDRDVTKWFPVKGAIMTNVDLVFYI